MIQIYPFRANFGPNSSSKCPGTSYIDDKDEDCLSLNIYVPKSSLMSQTEDAFSDNLPVLVYFHGGAFVVGSNRDGPLQPEHLGLVILANHIEATNQSEDLL